MKQDIKLSTVFAGSVIAVAILLTAYNGSLNWFLLALFALIVKVPIPKWLKEVISNYFKAKE